MGERGGKGVRDSFGGNPCPLSLRERVGVRVSRGVFLYVISGFKARNPAAAMALMDRLG